MNISDSVMAVLMLLVVWSFYRAQRDPNVNFNLFDLVMENGRVSKLASAFVLGVVALTWIMVRLTVTGHMTEGYVGLYGAIVITPVIAKLFSPPLTPGVTTNTVTSVTEVTNDKPERPSPHNTF